MSDTILSIDTPEGTYQLNCLVPSPYNKEPVMPLSSEVTEKTSNGQTAKRFKYVEQVPRTHRPLVIAAITPVFESEDDDDEGPSYFNVLCMPLPGSQYEQERMAVRIKIYPDQILRIYEGGSFQDITEEISFVLEPPAEEELTTVNAQLLAGAGPALDWMFKRLELPTSKLDLIREEIAETLNPTPEAPDAEESTAPNDTND